MIWDPPRLFAVAANGSVVVEKVFPRCEYVDIDLGCGGPWGRTKHYAPLWEIGFDRERRVMFASFTSCTWLRCKPARTMHIFRLPEL